MIILIFSFLFILLSSFNDKDSSIWNLEKDKNGIKVYSYIPPGEDLKHIKMSTTLNTRLSSLVSVLTDVPNYPNWIYNCSEAKLVKRINEQELIYYGVSDVPWPIDNRDMALHNKIYQDSLGVVHSVTKPAKNEIPIKNGMVRITDLNGSWTFTPLANGEIFIEYYLKIDIGGNVPSWVSNMFIAYGPYQSMLKYKEALKLERHKNASFNFIKD